MKSTLTAILVLLCSMPTIAQTTISNYVPGITAEGVAYYLPKTVINVSITTEKVSYTPGELCQYAERYLRITGISNKEDNYHTLLSATLTTEGVPDEKKLYHILFTPNSIAPLVSLTDSGILQAINTTASKMPSANAGTTLSVPHKISPRSYMTEEMLMAGSKAKLAELVAKEIYNIRESKNLIIRGQNEHMPKDAESLQIILAGLQEQEEALTQLFVGTTTKETSVQTYQVIPEGNVERAILGRFSRKLGLLHGDDLAGSPIYIDVKSKLIIPAPAEDSMSTTQQKGKKSKDNNQQDGLVYNLPGKASVKVYTNAQPLAEEIFSFAQFGNTETLSSTLLTKKKNIKITLDPITGALLKVEE